MDMIQCTHKLEINIGENMQIAAMKFINKYHLPLHKKDDIVDLILYADPSVYSVTEYFYMDHYDIVSIAKNIYYRRSVQECIYTHKCEELWLKPESEQAIHFTRNLRDLEVLEGSILRLNLDFKGYPDPVVIWLKNKKSLCIEDKKYGTKFEADKSISLLVYNVNPEDAGEYECIIRSDQGSLSTHGNVLVRAQDPSRVHNPCKPVEKKRTFVYPSAREEVFRKTFGDPVFLKTRK